MYNQLKCVYTAGGRKAFLLNLEEVVEYQGGLPYLEFGPFRLEAVKLEECNNLTLAYEGCAIFASCEDHVYEDISKYTFLRVFGGVCPDPIGYLACDPYFRVLTYFGTPHFKYHILRPELDKLRKAAYTECADLAAFAESV